MDAPLLSVERVDDGEAGLRLVVVGEIDMSTSPTLKSHLDDAAATTVGMLVVDLTKVSYIDSSGLNVLLAAWSSLAAGSRSLTTVPSPQARRLFEVACVEYLIGDSDAPPTSHDGPDQAAAAPD